ncbi:MAG: ABC transporter permease [Clostridiaceae bacterium]|nr:ABC transporter permease [Clostridiaceae bacterium]
MRNIIEVVIRQPVFYLITVLFIAFSIISPDFLSMGNLTNFLSGASILFALAIGMTFLIINGNFDLSVGAILAFCAALVIGTEEHSIAFSFIVAMIAGILLGLLNGLLVAKVGINAFIVTLAGMIGYRSLTYIYTNETSIIGTRDALTVFGTGSVGPIPYITIVCFVMLIIAFIVLKYTAHGRDTYAVGGNIEAARDAGIKVSKNLIINFVIMGFCAAIAGILFAAKINCSVPWVGDDYIMMAIAAVVLGGTKLAGGSGGIIQTFFGVIAIQLISNGLNLLYLPAKYSTLILGLVLILILYVDKWVIVPKK